MEHKQKAYEEERAETKAGVAEVVTVCYPTAASLDTPRRELLAVIPRLESSLSTNHVLELTRIEFDIQVGMKAAARRVTREPSRRLISCRTDIV